jgi:virginiamycin B lyase
VLAPDASTSIPAARRRPRYVSPVTASLAIVVNGAGIATILNLDDPAHCDASKKCSISLTAPAGNDTFLVSAYGGRDATGPLLSRATVSATIAGNGTTIVPAVLNGNVALLTVALASTPLTVHQAATVPITVTAKDASGHTIVGPGGYLNPITVTDSDKSGHSSITNATLNGPGDTTALRYDGGYAAGTITATAQFAQPEQPFTPGAAFAPTIATVETALPSGHGARSIIVGADGALWFADPSGSIGRMTTGGQLTQYPVPAGTLPYLVAPHPDGSIWFVTQGTQFASQTIGRIPSGGGSASTWTLATTGYAIQQLVAASDGNMFFNQTGKLNRITSTGNVTTYSLNDPTTNNALHVDSLVSGADGALWIGVDGGIARMLPSATTPSLVKQLGPIAFGSQPLSPYQLVVGPDSRIYFAANFQGIFAIDASATLSTIYAPPNGLVGGPITFAPDGSIWYPTPGGLGTVQTFGRVANGNLVPLTGTASQPGTGGNLPPSIDAMVAGPDGALWYSRGNAIGRLVP